MKRTLTIAALTLAVSMSLVAGTLSLYTITIDKLAEGNVVAKEFTLKPGETNTFAEDVKIAPGGKVEWEFSVKNHDGGIVSETAMDLAFTVDISDSTDKAAIAPLVVTVKDESNEEVGSNIGIGTIEFDDEFKLSDDGQEKTYTVSIEWPSDDAVDIDYAGAGFGTSIKVSVTGTQK